MFELALRVLALCLALSGAEMLHGIARVRFLVPRVGKRRAQQVSIVTGCLLAFLVCWWIVPTLGVTGRAPLLALGLVLALYMASFDVAVARLAMKRPWRSVAEDFNPLRGNYLLVGCIVLVFIPTVVMTLVER